MTNLPQPGPARADKLAEMTGLSLEKATRFLELNADHGGDLKAMTALWKARYGVAKTDIYAPGLSVQDMEREAKRAAREARMEAHGEFLGLVCADRDLSRSEAESEGRFWEVVGAAKARPDGSIKACIAVYNRKLTAREREELQDATPEACARFHTTCIGTQSDALAAAIRTFVCDEYILHVFKD